MTTYIIGSRQNPIFPNAQPENIIYVNGSILSVKKNQFKKAKQNIVLSPHLFVKNYEDLIKYKKNTNIKMFAKIRDLLADTHFSNIYIRPTSTSQKLLFSFEYNNLNTDFLNIYKNEEFDEFIIKSFYLNSIFSRLKYFTKNFFFDPFGVIKYLLGLRKIRMMKNFKISSGILGLMIAISDKKFNPPYFVIGIGLDNSGYSYKNNNRISNRKKHLKANLNYSNLLKKYKKNEKDIIFTNKDLSDYFNNN